MFLNFLKNFRVSKLKLKYILDSMKMHACILLNNKLFYINGLLKFCLRFNK